MTEYILNRYDYINANFQELNDYISKYINERINSQKIVNKELLDKLIDKCNSFEVNTPDYFKFEYLLENLAKYDKEINAAILNNTSFVISTKKEIIKNLVPETIENSTKGKISNNIYKNKEISDNWVDNLSSSTHDANLYQDNIIDFIDQKIEQEIYNSINFLIKEFNFNPEDLKNFEYNETTQELKKHLTLIYENITECQILFCIYNYHNVENNL